MLRISVQQASHSLLFVLEGRLVGPWVQELRIAWRQRIDIEPRPQLTVDLCGLTAMDTAGRDLLRELLHHGATLRCSDVMNQYLVEQMNRTSGRSEEECRPCQHFPKPPDFATSTRGDCTDDIDAGLPGATTHQPIYRKRGQASANRNRFG